MSTTTPRRPAAHPAHERERERRTPDAELRALHGRTEAEERAAEAERDAGHRAVPPAEALVAIAVWLVFGAFVAWYLHTVWIFVAAACAAVPAVIAAVRVGR